MTAYQKTISELLSTTETDLDPLHIEAFLRLQHGTLDALTREELRAGIDLFKEFQREGAAELCEQLAESMGLAGSAATPAPASR